MAGRQPTDVELLEFVGEIYDCAIEPAKWPAVLERLCGILDGREAAITLNYLREQRVALKAHWNQSPEFLAAMESNFATNPFHSSTWYCEIDQPVSAFALIDKAELANGTWYKRTIGAFAGGDAAMTLLAKSVTLFGSLSIHRAEGQPNFEASELRTLGLLAPHFRRAVMIADLLDTRALERDMLSATLDLMNAGVILTDAAARIVYSNAAAERLLADGRVLRRVGEEIAARDPQGASSLRQAIASAASGTTVDIPRAGHAVALKGGDVPDLAAWVLPLDGGLRRDLGASFAARAAVFVRELGDTSPFPAELFVRRYGITPAECRVLMLIVQGMTPKEAAETLGVTLPTAKTHLARLFDKTGTQRQADLVRLAMSALGPASG